MKIEKPSQLLAILGWVSVFVEGWLLVLRQVPSDALSWGFFTFFFLVAIGASAIASPSKKAG